MHEAYGLTHQGLVRSNNEDQYSASASCGLCVLADGMGGAQAGETASRIAVETVMESVSTHAHSPSLLADAFVEADRRVRQEAEANPLVHGMGTTLVAAVEVDGAVQVACVGDSRCWLWSGGRLEQVTSDQSWVNEIGRALGLSDEELLKHPLRHALTTAIGAGVEGRVQSHSLHPEPESILLLSSDGLHGVVSSEWIAQTLAAGGELPEIAQSLVDLALAAGGPDNVTVVLARI